MLDGKADHFSISATTASPLVLSGWSGEGASGEALSSEKRFIWDMCFGRFVNSLLLTGLPLRGVGLAPLRWRRIFAAFRRART